MAEHHHISSEEQEVDTGSWALGAVAVVLCMTLAIIGGVWQFKHRQEIAKSFKADIEFVSPPKTVAAGSASEFVIHVKRESKDTPLPDRVMDITVTPAKSAQIISASGASGTIHPNEASRATGRTDKEGNVSVMVHVTEPGKYTLVALDSTSNLEGTVNFQARGG
jgi:hypothetical protein